MLTGAFPGGKSLESSVRALFAAAGITMIGRNGSTHAVEFPDFPELYSGSFVKPSRVAALVERGVYDLGITGEDAVRESNADVEICTRLIGIGRSTSSGETRVVIFTASGEPIDDVSEIPDGSVILSEYPRLTREYFKERGKSVEVVSTQGSCEAEVPTPYRFGVALVDSGKSLRENNLKPIGTLCTSATVLVANKKRLEIPSRRRALEHLQTILLGALSAKGKVLLSMNVPAESLTAVTNILPSLGSPTIAPLQNGGSSVSVVATQVQLNALVAQLKAFKVTGIIATPLITIIP